MTQNEVWKLMVDINESIKAIYYEDIYSWNITKAQYWNVGTIRMVRIYSHMIYMQAMTWILVVKYVYANVCTRDFNYIH